MYEKVVIVGVELLPVRPSDRSTGVGKLRVYSYTADGHSRDWEHWIAGISKGEAHAAKRREFMVDNMPTGTIYHLLGAAGIESEDYDALFQSVQAGNIDHSVAIERHMESRAMQICRAAGQATFDGTEKEIAKDIFGALIGRVVRIDWERRGQYGNLIPHAMNILPSRDNGKDTFGGVPIDEWVAKHDNRGWDRGMSQEDRLRREGMKLRATMVPSEKPIKKPGFLG